MAEQDIRKDKLSADLLLVLDKIELIVKQIVTTASQVALYAVDHPAVREYAERAYSTMGEILGRKESFTVSIREGMLVYESIPLYRLSFSARKFIDLFEAKNIHGMIVKRGLPFGELLQFIALLVESPEKLQGRDAVNLELVRRGVRHIEVMQVSKEEEEARALRPPRVIYGDAVHTFRRVVRSIMKRDAINMREVEGLSREISATAQKDRRAMLDLTKTGGSDEYAYVHPVNVCILTTALATLFTKDAAVIAKLCKAALLHDVGKALIPLEILLKRGKLNEVEWALVRRHPADGAKILGEAEGGGGLPAIVAFEHHMRYDMSGYPATRMIRRIHPLGLLVQVANAYDAMVTERPYRAPMTREQALAEMAPGAGTAFEPTVLKEFMKMMGDEDSKQ
jgi:HD-GYP domain-containing protein (c-di-GMP phosphodiesterase class II)